MEVTITIDDSLYEQALALVDPKMDADDLFNETIKAFIRVESAKRIAALGRQRTGNPE